MYCVHWLLTRHRHTADQIAAWKDMTGEELNIYATEYVPQFQVFGSDELTPALKFCEALRTRRRNGERLSFICMASEDPNSVGEQGVNDKLPEGYDWKKRRI